MDAILGRMRCVYGKFSGYGTNSAYIEAYTGRQVCMNEEKYVDEKVYFNFLVVGSV